MNRIEVQLDRDTQVLEFHAPVKAVRIPDQPDTLKRLFPIVCLIIGMLLGKVIFSPNGEVYNPESHRVISAPGIRDLYDHGLTWCKYHQRWEKKSASTNFPILDIE